MSDNDGENAARRAGRAFEAAGERLIDRGVSEADVGSAMVAAGLSFWSRAIGAEAVVKQLANLTIRTAKAAGIDMDQAP